jgi:hypothetical protein
MSRPTHTHIRPKYLDDYEVDYSPPIDLPRSDPEYGVRQSNWTPFIDEVQTQQTPPYPFTSKYNYTDIHNNNTRPLILDKKLTSLKSFIVLISHLISIHGSWIILVLVCLMLMCLDYI